MGLAGRGLPGGNSLSFASPNRQVSKEKATRLSGALRATCDDRKKRGGEEAEPE